MTDLNRVVVIGNLTRSLENLSYIGNGTAKGIVAIAVNRSRKQGESWVNETSYFDVEIWGKTAENLKPYLNKGQKIAVDGYLKQDRWEKDGQKHDKIKIVAESVELCGGKTTTDDPNHIVKKATPATETQTDFGFDDDIAF